MGDYTKLVIFDCDGTLVDSQHQIIGALHETFDLMGIPEVSDARARTIVGLSLHEAMTALLPDGDDALHARLAEAYKATFYRRRVAAQPGPDPLYDGTLAVLEQLNDAGYLLGVATGNSVRGLNRVIAEHNLGHLFVTLQTADHHPSKPHPSMVQAAVTEAGSHMDHAVMIGDTSYDIKMARAAGCGAIGVNWGYHGPEELHGAGAHHVVSSFYELPALIEDMIGRAA